MLKYFFSAQSEKPHLSTVNVCKRLTLYRLGCSIVPTYCWNTRAVKSMFSWDFGNTFSHEGLSRWKNPRCPSLSFVAFNSSTIRKYLLRYFSMLSALRSYMSPVSIVPEKQQLQANSSLPLSAEGTSGSPLATTPTSPRPRPTDMSGLPGTGGSIVLGYRGTFAFGRDGMADVCFRKLTRILVHGKVSMTIILYP